MGLAKARVHQVLPLRLLTLPVRLRVPRPLLPLQRRARPLNRNRPRSPPLSLCHHRLLRMTDVGRHLQRRLRLRWNQRECLTCAWERVWEQSPSPTAWGPANQEPASPLRALSGTKLKEFLLSTLRGEEKPMSGHYWTAHDMIGHHQDSVIHLRAT